MLIILPCAGGCAASYLKYKSYIPDTVLYEYPGHWSRRDEPLCEDSESLLIDIVSELNLDENGICILGHSMGGIIAWFLAEKLLYCGFRVNGIYLAACVPPGFGYETEIDVDDDLEVIRFLKRVRMVPNTYFQKPYFEDKLLPAIKSDLRIVRELLSVDYSCLSKISIPIKCYYGLNDPIVKKEDIEKWNKITSYDFNCEGCKGDHFFINDVSNIDIIASEIKSDLLQYVSEN